MAAAPACAAVSVILGLAGRRVDLAGDGGATLLEALTAAGAAPPPGRAWSVFCGTEPRDVSAPLSTLAGQELTAVLVADLLDWCCTATCPIHFQSCRLVCAGAASRPRLSETSEHLFGACGLVHPGDEVVCLLSQRRARLPERAVRLVGLVGHAVRCTHAVTRAGRSSCVRAPSGVAAACCFAEAFKAAEDHGGPSAFVEACGVALMLCADGSLLWSRATPAGAWPGAGALEGRFVQVARDLDAVAALSAEGEVLAYAVGDWHRRGKAVRLWSAKSSHFPRRWLLASNEAGAARFVAPPRELGCPQAAQVLAALETRARPHGGCVALAVDIGLWWFFALAADGVVLAHNCGFWVFPTADAACSLQRGLDEALSEHGCRCARLVPLQHKVLLLLESHRALVVAVEWGELDLAVQCVPGEVEDVLETDVGAILRMDNGDLFYC